VTSASVQSSATTSLNSLSVNMSNVTFFTVALDSVWCRDYGPRYVYEGNVRVITDHQYNRPRPNDDLEPNAFSTFHKQQYYQIGLNGTNLIHGGGNFHLDAHGDAYATTLITDENPSFTAAQVQQVWNTYEGDNVTLTGRFPTTVDSTGHIDMWMQIYGDNKVFISDWPNNVGSTQDVICDNTAALMASRGYNVTRLPAYSIGGTHYTYTNMVIFNNIVLLPQYNNGPGAAVSTTAFNQVQAAFGPSYTVFQINADAIIPSAGAFHCIVQHVPIEKGLAGVNGGLAPVAYLRGPNNSPTVQAGQQLALQWITDDDAPVAASGGVQTVDLLLSTDGGATFPTTIASGQPALGSFNWTVPAGINTSQARIRVVAHDGVGNTGFDDTDANFSINDPAVPAVAASDFPFEQAPHRLNFTFSQNVSASLGTDDLVLENLTSSQTISASDLSLSYNTGTNVATFTYTGPGGVLPDGSYRATLLAAGITSPGGTPMSSNVVYNFFVLAGDANRDRSVNLLDFNILSFNFGQSPRTFSQGDFNYDGSVNLLDFNILSQRFGQSVAPSTFAAGAFGNGSASRLIDDVLA
jgi:agmatine/peptidylarginine deiminase